MEELDQLCRLCASDMKVQESYPITKPEDFKKIDSLLPVKVKNMCKPLIFISFLSQSSKLLLDFDALKCFYKKIEP